MKKLRTAVFKNTITIRLCQHILVGYEFWCFRSVLGVVEEDNIVIPDIENVITPSDSGLKMHIPIDVFLYEYLAFRFIELHQPCFVRHSTCEYDDGCFYVHADASTTPIQG